MSFPITWDIRSRVEGRRDALGVCEATAKPRN